MSNSAINSALSGLSAAQLSLDTVGNNIANSSTQGYSRQSALLAQANSTFNGAGWIGNGVNVTGVKREYDDFITHQLRDAQNINSQMEARYQQMKKVDDLVANSNTISSSLQDFFTGLQTLTSNADDGAARQTLLGQANALVNQFKVTDNYLRNIDKQVNTELESTVVQINAYAKQIANLNMRISKLTAVAGGETPNDLLDKRDMLVSELNKLTDVQTTSQDGKSFTITIANGIPLVQGDSVTELKAIPSAKDPNRITVAIVDNLAGNVEIPENLLTTGSIGGLLAFRSQDLDQVINSLNQLARAFVESFNAQHRAGFDLNGEKGQDFFTIDSPKISENTSSTPSKVKLTVTIDPTNVNALQASEYNVSFDGTDWKVTHAKGGAPVTVTPESDPITKAITSISFDGLTVAIDGTPKASDNFTVTSVTVTDTIGSLSVNVTDPARIALGKTADSGPGDNTNGQKLLDLQNKKIIGGSRSFNDAWAGLIGDVGNKTKTYQVTSNTQASVVKQLTKQQQSVSGVNLDEEYGSLQHFQQYYMANAKALQTASTLFDALLSAIR